MTEQPSRVADGMPGRRRGRRRFPRWAAFAAIVVTLTVVGTAVAHRITADEPPQLMWGIGDELPAATSSPLYRTGTAGMVTAWFNGPADVSWMSGYSQPSTISDIYGSGSAIELVVYLADHPQYAVSRQFQRDLRTIVTAFKGSGPHYGPLYVVLFTEWETYSSDPAYQDTLRQSYLAGVQVVHSAYSQARVALGFGGYEWSDQPTRDLSRWSDAIAASDFTAVQAMQDCSSERDGQNIVVPQIRSSVHQLGSYGKPVMISHFKLWGDPACQVRAFRAVAKELFTDASMAELARDHLFAWDFMQDAYLTDSWRSDPSVRSLIERHARPRPAV